MACEDNYYTHPPRYIIEDILKQISINFAKKIQVTFTFLVDDRPASHVVSDCDVGLVLVMRGCRDKARLSLAWLLTHSRSESSELVDLLMKTWSYSRAPYEWVTVLTNSALYGEPESGWCYLGWPRGSPWRVARRWLAGGPPSKAVAQRRSSDGPSGSRSAVSMSRFTGTPLTGREIQKMRKHPLDSIPWLFLKFTVNWNKFKGTNRVWGLVPIALGLFFCPSAATGF